MGAATEQLLFLMPNSMRGTQSNAFSASSSILNKTSLSSPKGVKSPHSKLLRVCSSRNANPHFAAIEAELLRLNWKEAMDALVEDWVENNRWDDFIELERNVKSYVDKNLMDLCDNNPEHREGSEESVTLLDHVLRSYHFPYEAIITKAVHHALAGKVILSRNKLQESEGDKNKKSLAELRERIAVLSDASKLLDARHALMLIPKRRIIQLALGGVCITHHAQTAIAVWCLDGSCCIVD